MKIDLGTESITQETCNSTVQIERTIDKIIQTQKSLFQFPLEVLLI